jgi:hypothetical protein
MFGGGVTRAAFAEQGLSIQEVRDSQKLGIVRAAGGVVSLSSTVLAPVPKNTFYGDV